MSVIISVLKARMAALAIANAATHVLALAGRGYAWLDPAAVNQTFTDVASIVVLTTGTLGIMLPQIKKKVQFVDTEGIVK